jgi:SlyX protein
MNDTPAELAERLERLEIRIAYQDRTIEELHAALAAQWREIDRLKRDFDRLSAEMADAADGRAGAGLPEPPPPHY